MRGSSGSSFRRPPGFPTASAPIRDGLHAPPPALQRLLIGGTSSVDPTTIDGPALRAIYEATWYRAVVQMMVKDGIEDHTKWRFFLERLKKVEPYPAYAGYVAVPLVGPQEVVQL